METRLIAAYGLLLLIGVIAMGLIAYRRYHSHQRSYQRRIRRESRIYATRPAAPADIASSDVNSVTPKLAATPDARRRQ